MNIALGIAFGIAICAALGGTFIWAGLQLD